MSKLLLLPLILFLFSCQNDKQEAPKDTVGQVKRYEPLELNDAELNKVYAICQALADKEGVLSVLRDSGQEYHFDYAQKNCADAALPAYRNVITTIQGFDPHYSFQPRNGEAFGFQAVETTSAGMIAEVCEKVLRGETVKSPDMMRTGAMWFTTVTSNEHCKADASSYCIHVQRGSPIDSLNYRIHTNEWMKVKITQPRRGFFMEKKLISSASCDKGQTFEKKAVLK